MVASIFRCFSILFFTYYARKITIQERETYEKELVDSKKSKIIGIGGASLGIVIARHLNQFTLFIPQYVVVCCIALLHCICIIINRKFVSTEMLKHDYTKYTIKLIYEKKSVSIKMNNMLYLIFCWCLQVGGLFFTLYLIVFFQNPVDFRLLLAHLISIWLFYQKNCPFTTKAKVRYAAMPRKN